jgi:hypothetical protein
MSENESVCSNIDGVTFKINSIKSDQTFGIFLQIAFLSNKGLPDRMFGSVQPSRKNYE